jgi:hypothetical protein
MIEFQNFPMVVPGGSKMCRLEPEARAARGECLLKLQFHKGQGHQWDRGWRGPTHQTKP